MPDPLEHAVIVYETEAAARARLAAHGYAPEIAAEIAVYLAQATDLPGHMEAIGAALAGAGIAAEFVELDALPARLPALMPRAERTILWCQTDGIRYYRGSAVPALARLCGFSQYGSPPPAQHLCQDKFASLALAAGASLPVLPTLLLEDEETIAALGTAAPEGPYFVKPNTLGAKIGIVAESRCTTLAEARALSARLWRRYRDRAIVQPFVEGDDVRVSFMGTGGEFQAQVGIWRLARNPASETGGAFLTMKDNETLSGARDTAGTRGGFGAGRDAAFVPRLIDLKAGTDARSARAAAAIAAAAFRLARLVGLRDYFSMDFRIDAAGNPTFFEFEVCPAVTIYDFQEYLRGNHGLGLGEALARSVRLAHARRGRMGEA